MKYSFEVILEEKDYYEYNKFWLLKSHYGKKNVLSMRIMLAVMILAVSVFSLFLGKFKAVAFLSLIPYALIFAVIQLAIAPLFAASLKSNIKRMKKSGKMPYSSVSVISFSEEGFVETTSEGQTEHPYTALERISAVEGKMLYLHVNNVMAYLIPYTTFESHAQYEELLAFLAEKCANIDHYKSKK